MSATSQHSLPGNTGGTHCNEAGEQSSGVQTRNITGAHHATNSIRVTTDHVIPQQCEINTSADILHGRGTSTSQSLSRSRFKCSDKTSSRMSTLFCGWGIFSCVAGAALLLIYFIASYTQTFNITNKDALSTAGFVLLFFGRCLLLLFKKERCYLY